MKIVGVCDRYYYSCQQCNKVFAAMLSEEVFNFSLYLHMNMV